MKRAIMAVLTYSIAGRGFYKVFFDNANIYGFLILSVGLAGGLYDIFYQKLKAAGDSQIHWKLLYIEIMQMGGFCMFFIYVSVQKSLFIYPYGEVDRVFLISFE